MLKKLTAVLFLLFISISATAQPTQLSSFGHDFYAAFMPSSMVCVAITPFQSYWIVVNPPYDCNVTISYFDQTTGQEFQDHTYHVLAKNFVQIPINTGYTVVHNPLDGTNLNNDGEVPEYTAIHVHTDNIATVSYFSTGPDDATMYCVLPEHALGKHYVVAAAPNDDGTGGGTPRNCSTPPEPSSSFFGVLAVRDNTHINVTPSGTTRGDVTGVTSGPNANRTPHPFTVTLKRGQVYWVKSEIKSHPGIWEIDMTGSHVDADQPVAVFAGCENAFNGVTALGINDNRNLNFGMMIPYEYWVSSGYLVLPMKDTPNIGPGDNTYGDQVKVVVSDQSPNGCMVHADLADLGPRDNAIVPYQFPPVTFDNVDMGSVISSPCDQKIFVEQYDYRAIASRSERMATAPTMMNVVPASGFVKSMMWSVPDDALQVAKFRFINVIANPSVFSKINLWKDGKVIGSMASLTPAGSTKFPAPYSHLEGRLYSVGVGCYFATCDSAFAIYQTGTSAYDYPDKDLGDFDNDDYFHAYATATGQSFSSTVPSSLKVDLKTNCASWDLTAGGSPSAPLAMIEILNDPLGILARTDSGSGYVSSNIRFAPNAKFSSGDTSAILQLIPINPLMKAEGWVLVQDQTGQSVVLHLTYAPTGLAFAARDSNGIASIAFLRSLAGKERCGAFVLHNNGDRAYQITNASFAHGGQNVFQISSINKPLPVMLDVQDSLVVNVCYNTSRVNQTFYDTIVITTECQSFFGKLSGASGSGSILAADRDFISVEIDSSSCAPVRIQNTGSADFVLNKWSIKQFGNSEFVFSDSARFPLTILAGGSVNLNVCFIPKDTLRDSAIITWGTDIPPPDNTKTKNYSVLYGKGFSTSSLDVPKNSDLHFAFSLSPNPSHDELTLNGSLDKASSVAAQVLDILGQEIKRINLSEVSAGEFTIRFDTRSWPDGIYFVKMVAGDHSITRRLVKSR